MTHFYGIKPWEIEQMTLGEVRVYLEQFREHLNVGAQALYEEVVERQRDGHRDILGLPDPPKFHR